MSKQTFTLAHPLARKRAMAAVAEAPDGFVVTVSEPTRNLEQNAKLWAMLTEVSEQVVWHSKKLSPENWKAVFSSAIRKLEVVPNLDGTGFVALGQSTSQMSKREFGEMLELIAAFGAQHGVEFNEPAMTA
jgi:hypothetical protein